MKLMSGRGWVRTFESYGMTQIMFYLLEGEGITSEPDSVSKVERLVQLCDFIITLSSSMCDSVSRKGTVRNAVYSISNRT